MKYLLSLLFSSTVAFSINWVKFPGEYTCIAGNTTIYTTGTIVKIECNFTTAEDYSVEHAWLFKPSNQNLTEEYNKKMPPYLKKASEIKTRDPEEPLEPNKDAESGPAGKRSDDYIHNLNKINKRSSDAPYKPIDTKGLFELLKYTDQNITYIASPPSGKSKSYTFRLSFNATEERSGIYTLQVLLANDAGYTGFHQAFNVTIASAALEGSGLSSTAIIMIASGIVAAVIVIIVAVVIISKKKGE